MKEFFTTSGLPYWILFILAVGVDALCLKVSSNDSSADKPAISKNTMLLVSGAMIFVALCTIILYATLGGNALWWVHDEEVGYFSRVLLAIPLFLFLVAEVLSPYFYKLFMQTYFGVDNLSIKPQFISIVVIVPAALLLIYTVGSFFMDASARAAAFYAVAGVGLVVAIIFSLRKNILSVGSKGGIIYTITSFVLCAASLVSVLYFVVAIISLILELLPVIATIIAIAIIFGKSYGNSVMRRDNDGNYIANDGSKHSSASARDSRDSQLRARQS